MKNVTFILLSVLIISCSNKYSINKDQLKCRFKIDQGFNLDEIEVTKFNKEGMPEEYDKILSIYFTPLNEDQIKKDSFKEFKFKEKNGDYKWKFDPSCSFDHFFYDTLPIQFKNDTWYLIKMTYETCYIDNLFFMFKENGEVIDFHQHGKCGEVWESE